MRILSITAGAAGMYCGSCFRDNALAAELLARGHDVTLQPVYTPTLVDEPNVSETTVLLGGINIYLQHSSALFRRLPRFVERLLDSPRVIRTLARGGGTTDPRLLGELTLSTLDGRSGVLRKEFDKLAEWIRSEPLPDVINIPNSLLIAMAAPLREATGRPVCCTLQGEELFLSGLQPAYRARALEAIQRQVPSVDRFIAVSDYGAAFMADLLRIPPARIDVVPLGINLQGYERREAARDRFAVGYFARIAPEKGLHELARAYVAFRRRAEHADARLEVAGYMAPSQSRYLDGARAILADAGYAGEFRYHGAVDRTAKLAFLRELDVLSVPATYDEPKGMFLLEAMASGVPVVQPRRGAFTEVVEKTGGGLLVTPDETDSLADALHALWRDRDRARVLGRQAFEGVRAHYSIQQSAARLVEVYQAVLGERRTSVA
jgi:glycosyltransferase involved in cell wall biosynthesis